MCCGHIDILGHKDRTNKRHFIFIPTANGHYVLYLFCGRGVVLRSLTGEKP